MTIPMLLGKLHRATCTGADLHYEGSISIDPALIQAAGFRTLQQIEIYNIDNGERFSTYIIHGQPGEVSLNGAAARRVQKGDRLILCAYGQVPIEMADGHRAKIVLLGPNNRIESEFEQSATTTV
jgi:aspartate 1-decarboxylase